MNLSVVNFVVGFVVGIGSLAIATRLKNRGVKISIFLLGVIVGGIIAFFPAIRCRISSPRLPEDAEILRLLYGPGIEIQTGPGGKTPFILKQLSEIEKEQFQYAAQLSTQIAYKVGNWDGDPLQLLVLTSTGQPDCCERALTPVVGGALLHWTDEAWKVISYQKLIVSFTRVDLLADADIIEIGPKKNALVLTDDRFLARGFENRNLILAVVDEKLKLVADIETLANNKYFCPPSADTEPCWEYRASYKFIRGTQPDYYDLRVTTDGTKLVNGGLAAVHKTIDYIFTDGVFQPAGQ